MNAEIAREKFKEIISEAISIAKEKGFAAKGKTYYSDKTLREFTEFDESIILLFGGIDLGLADMDEEDFCTFGLCCEIKLGMINEEELEREIEDFRTNINNFFEEVAAAPSPKKKIEEINLRQEKDAEKSMAEFEGEMKKVKLKLYGALAILALIVIGIIIAGFFI